MSSMPIVWEVPEDLYHELIHTQHELAFPQLADLLTQAVRCYLAEMQHQLWQQEFRALQQQVRAGGGIRIGATKEEIIATLREQRRELFETEYAHLYRQ